MRVKGWGQDSGEKGGWRRGHVTCGANSYARERRGEQINRSGLLIPRNTTQR